MLIEKLIIINKLGLHARATAKLVTLVNQYKSDVEIELKNNVANAKSIMSVLMLAAAKGSEISVKIMGEDEQACLLAVQKLVNNRFGERE